MLRFDKAIYFSFLLKPILSVKLSNSLRRSDALLFLGFVNVIIYVCIIRLLNSLYCYTLF